MVWRCGSVRRRVGGSDQAVEQVSAAADPAALDDLGQAVEPVQGLCPGRCRWRASMDPLGNLGRGPVLRERPHTLRWRESVLRLMRLANQSNVLIRRKAIVPWSTKHHRLGQETRRTEAANTL